MSSSTQTADLGQSFVAVDFETATSERNSACAVGAVVFEQGSPTDTLSLLIRPPGNHYDGFNTMIHGIGPSDTRRSSGFPEAWEQVAGMLDGRLVIAHNTAFDLSVLRRSAEHHGYEPDPFPFACTYRIARSAMPDATSWSLDVLADDFGIPLSHHDPLSDAHAAGLLWRRMPERFGTTHSDLLASLGYRLGYCHLDGYKPFSNAAASSSGSSKSFGAKDFTPNGQPDPKGLLFSKRIVFTGTLESMPRREAFQAAVDAGATPSQSVSKRTNYLVVGATDLRKVGETGLSSKHRKALALAAEGSTVENIDKDEFICLLAGMRISAEHPMPAPHSLAVSKANGEAPSGADVGRDIADANDRRRAAPSASRPRSDAGRADRSPKHARMGLLEKLFGRPGTRRVSVTTAPPAPECLECGGQHDPLPEELVAYEPPYEWCEIVKDHKRGDRYDEALVILDGCMRVEKAHRGGVAPWYHEQAAIIHRKRRDRDAELAVLRRFAAQQHAPGAKPPKLLERLAKLETTATSQ